MVQGKSKLKPKKAARVTKQQSNPRAAAPRIHKAKKNASAKNAQKLTNVHLAVLLSSTEKLIAGRVGHLEIVKGSRRSLEKQGKLDAFLAKTKGRI
ncbi:hypothetical protein BABINDRAFT_60724 [Babjeviella inositovora NRRL Y-12698]|uniref:Uncharacterized protein n=1 Tax=Babjeviella inositovora NRRL Y-12698 TaxID=984486 RepID=A0A1E3QST8_9ASCO|nr:uncharacterized protein BABINDRAFT_60724 [Babjeviella inositovora NRRL Y-12698]ODQ80708.1 hypothetical protein BABINDRAFT_60724 [Babjeviella inositovora NRRL Y-12698]